MSEPPTDGGPGWDAIDAALRPRYGDTRPLHYGAVPRWSLGGNNPLDGISAYKRTDGECHWHFVSYGLTELFQKESKIPDVSGWGLELTFRVACRPDDPKPPIWAMNFLQNIGRYIVKTGNVFAPGHHMSLNGPIAANEATELAAMLCVADPELPACESPNGRFSFLQIVGITVDELEAAQTWDSLRFAEILARRSPLLVTDLQRRSILADEEIAKQVATATEREGSSMSDLFAPIVEWSEVQILEKRTRIVIDGLTARQLVPQLRGRLLHDRPLLLCGQTDQARSVVAFRHAEKPSIAVDDAGYLVVTLSRAMIDELREKFRPERGVYRSQLMGQLELEVVPLEIKDNQGNVIRVVG